MIKFMATVIEMLIKPQFSQKLPTPEKQMPFLAKT
jgi:hypothetical protein